MPVAKHKNSGFTLIEMMVSVTIFSIVMLVSVASILAIVEANRKAQSLKSIVNNLNFTMETISRNVRVGTTLHCFVAGNGAIPNTVASGPQDCNAGGDALALEAQFGVSGDPDDQVVYRLYDGTIYRHVGLPGLPPTASSGAGSIAVPLTAPEVTIEHMRFFVDGNTLNAEGEQPRVRITIQGYAEVGRERTKFNLQTTVVQRILDMPTP